MLNSFEMWNPDEQEGVQCMECESYYNRNYECTTCKIADYLIELTVDEIHELKRQIKEY